MQPACAQKIEIQFYVPTTPSLAMHLTQHEFTARGMISSYYEDTLNFRNLVSDYESMNEERPTSSLAKSQTHKNSSLLRKESDCPPSTQALTKEITSETLSSKKVIDFFNLKTKRELKKDMAQKGLYQGPNGTLDRFSGLEDPSPKSSANVLPLKSKK